MNRPMNRRVHMRFSRPLPIFISSTLKKRQDFLKECLACWHVFCNLNYIHPTGWSRRISWQLVGRLVCCPILTDHPICSVYPKMTFPPRNKRKLGRNIWDSAFVPRINKRNQPQPTHHPLAQSERKGGAAPHPRRDVERSAASLLGLGWSVSWASNWRGVSQKETPFQLWLHLTIARFVHPLGIM